jgi:serine/threonine protein kinase
MVKVLDFGLAKTGIASVPASTDRRTLDRQCDRSGGHSGYCGGTCPPEQAKGRPVDRRADIWAFGVVLLTKWSRGSGCSRANRQRGSRRSPEKNRIGISRRIP